MKVTLILNFFFLRIRQVEIINPYMGIVHKTEVPF